MKAFLKVVLAIIIVAVLLISLYVNVNWLDEKRIENKIATQVEMYVQNTGDMYSSYYRLRGYHISVMPCNADYVDTFGTVHDNSSYYLVVVICSYDGYGNQTESFLAEYNHGTILINGL